MIHKTTTHHLIELKLFEIYAYCTLGPLLFTNFLLFTQAHGFSSSASSCPLNFGDFMSLSTRFMISRYYDSRRTKNLIPPLNPHFPFKNLKFSITL